MIDQIDLTRKDIRLIALHELENEPLEQSNQNLESMIVDSTLVAQPI